MTLTRFTYPHDFDGTGKKPIWLDSAAVTAVTTEGGVTYIRCGGQRFDVAETLPAALEKLALMEKPRNERNSIVAWLRNGMGRGVVDAPLQNVIAGIVSGEHLE